MNPEENFTLLVQRFPPAGGIALPTSYRYCSNKTRLAKMKPEDTNTVVILLPLQRLPSQQ